MSETAAQIPVVWKTTQEVVSRLLGENGRLILEGTLALAQDLAFERQWPLERIRVEFYQDPEVVWDYLLLVLVFDCEPRKAERLWDEFVDGTEKIELKLNEQEIELFIKKINYEFECSPQF